MDIKVYEKANALARKISVLSADKHEVLRKAGDLFYESTSYGATINEDELKIRRKVFEKIKPEIEQMYNEEIRNAENEFKKL